MAPLVFKKKEEDLPPPDKDSNQDKKTIRGFKIVHVFDVSQTDGDELPKFASVHGEPRVSLERLEVLMTENNIQVSYEPIAGGALGVSQGGSVCVRPDLEIAKRFSVLVHEFAHEKLHRSERRKETTKTIRETEAEAVAFVVCQAIGIETGTASSDYIQLYNGSSETLSESLHHIQKAASEILVGIMQNEK